MLEKARIALSQSEKPEDIALIKDIDARIKKFGDITSASVAGPVAQTPETPITEPIQNYLDIPGSGVGSDGTPCGWADWAELGPW